MRITRISVGGFGQFNGAHLQPAAGLTVIRGPNEAGKTTLLAFTRAMLFGFESGRYPALSGGKRGGWLDVEMQDGRAFRIERYGERGGGGSLRVLDADGKDLGAGYLPTLLQGVESKVYRNIFAFGLEELTQFERLTDSEVAARIYGAGLGTGSVSGLDVENALRNERDTLFKPGGQKPAINLLLRSLEEIDGQLRDRDLPREYGEAGARLARVEVDVADVNTRHAELDAERRRQQRLIDGWSAWLERSRATTEREALGDVRSFEAAVLEQLGRLETTLADSARGADQAAKARELAQESLDSAEIDGVALERRTELEALAEATKIEIAQQKERARTDRELTEAHGRVDAAVTKLGTDWSVERIESFDDSIAVQAEITGRFRTLLEGSDQAVASARRDLAAATASLEETTRQAEATAERVAGLETELGDRPPWATRDRALREIESLGERLASQRRIAADTPAGDLAATRAALEARTAAGPRAGSGGGVGARGTRGAGECDRDGRGHHPATLGAAAAADHAGCRRPRGRHRPRPGGRVRARGRCRGRGGGGRSRRMGVRGPPDGSLRGRRRSSATPAAARRGHRDRATRWGRAGPWRTASVYRRGPLDRRSRRGTPHPRARRGSTGACRGRRPRGGAVGG